MSRVRSFTIIEIIIGLIITNILVIIIFFCLQTYKHQYLKYQNILSQKNDLILLNTVLHSDITKAESIYDSSGMIIIRIPLKFESINYVFSNDYVIRASASSTDSFFIRMTDFLIEHISNTKYVETFSFTSQLNKNPLFSRFKKQYSAKQLIDIESSYYGK